MFPGCSISYGRWTRVLSLPKYSLLFFLSDLRKHFFSWPPQLLWVKIFLVSPPSSLCISFNLVDSQHTALTRFRAAGPQLLERECVGPQVKWAIQPQASWSIRRGWLTVYKPTSGGGKLCVKGTWQSNVGSSERCFFFNLFCLGSPPACQGAFVVLLWGD
jgi:hypothetical protein